MAKKIKNKEDEVIVENNDLDSSSNEVSKSKKNDSKNKEKSEKNLKKENGKDDKNAKKSSKKPNKEKRSLGKRIKETTSELKKVSWPSFGKVVKQTGVVILVVTICTLLLFGIDKLFSLIYNVLTK